MQKIVSATEARKNFYELVRQTSRGGPGVTIVPADGNPPVAMISRSEFDRIQEELANLS